MRAGISTNVHRGKDAVGFFTGYSLPAPTKSVWWKSKGEGVNHLDFIEKNLRNHAIPNVLGLHARAASGTFKPELNSNNHPVVYNNAMAIHNGYIRNHESIRKLPDLREDEIYKNDETFPKVDSLAIPLLMDMITGDPKDHVQEIAMYFAMLSGGWATHVIWKDRPDVTLLVAGPSYPLTIKWGAGRLSYASEAQTLDAMWSDLPFPKKAVAREMDTGTFILVEQGEPVVYGTYDVERRRYDKLLKDNKVDSPPSADSHIRINPHTNERVKVSKFKRKYKEDETREQKLWSSLDTPANTQIIYDRKHGLYVNDKTKAIFEVLKPTHTYGSNNRAFIDGARLGDYLHLPWADALFEADEIFAIKRDLRDADLFGWFGDVEIVVQDTGGILNIYDWSKHLNTDRVEWEENTGFEERRAEVLKEYNPLLSEYRRTPGGDFSQWGKWFKNNARDARNSNKTGVVGVASNVTPLQRHRGQIGETSTATSRIRLANQGLPIEFPLSAKGTARQWLIDNLKMDKIQIANIPYIALADGHQLDPWDDVEDMEAEVVYHHATNATIPFLYNELCPIHQHPLKTHSAPFQCEYLILSALALMPRVKNLDQFENLYYGDVVVTLDFTNENSSYVSYKVCDHNWVETESMIIETYDLWYSFPQADQCTDCFAARTVKTWPKIVREMIHSFNVFETTNVEGVC